VAYTPSDDEFLSQIYGKILLFEITGVSGNFLGYYTVILTVIFYSVYISAHDFPDSYDRYG